MLRELGLIHVVTCTVYIVPVLLISLSEQIDQKF